MGLLGGGASKASIVWRSQLICCSPLTRSHWPSPITEPFSADELSQLVRAAAHEDGSTGVDVVKGGEWEKDKCVALYYDPSGEPVEKKEPEQEKKEGEEEEAEQPSMRAQVQVMWGNTLFEQSQMRARLGKEWRPLLDVAVEKFKGAGCAEADIEQALKVHRGVRAEKEA